MNKAIIIGNICKDLELKHTQNGQAVTNFNVAVQRNFTNANGEKETDFISVVAWGKTAENASVYLAKGSKVAVEGRIQVRNYDDNNGKKIYVVEIVAEQVQFLDTKGTNQQAQPANNTDVNNKQDMHNDANDFFDNFGNNNDITDDDLPF